MIFMVKPEELIEGKFYSAILSEEEDGNIPCDYILRYIGKIKPMNEDTYLYKFIVVFWKRKKNKEYMNYHDIHTSLYGYEKEMYFKTKGINTFKLKEDAELFDMLL